MNSKLYFLILTLTLGSGNLLSMEEPPAKKVCIEETHDQEELDEALCIAIEGNEGEDPDSKPNLEHIQELLTKGANINTKVPRDVTPLYLAVEGNHCDVAEMLLNQGALVDSAGTLGATPLHRAAENLNLEIIELLLQHKANPNALDNKQWTPLHYAVAAHTYSNEYDDELTLEIVKLLVDYGANVNLSTEESWTLVHQVAWRDKLLTLQFLLSLQSTAIVNARDDRGRTPLHEAAMNNNFNMVEFLLKQGADINAQDDTGRVPWCLAMIALNWELADRLLTVHGARVIATHQKNTETLRQMFKGDLLMLGVLLSDKDKAKELIAQEKDEHRLKQAFDYAVGQGKKELLPIILERAQEHVDVQKALQVLEGILAKQCLTQEERKNYQEVKCYLTFCLPLTEKVMQKPSLRQAIVMRGGMLKLPKELSVKLVLSAVKAGDIQQAVQALISDALYQKLITTQESLQATVGLYSAVLGKDTKERKKIINQCLEWGAIPTELFLHVLSELEFSTLLSDFNLYSSEERALVRMLFESAQAKGVVLTKDILTKYLPMFEIDKKG
jgi:ankyrin repeat protein